MLKLISNLLKPQQKTKQPILEISITSPSLTAIPKVYEVNKKSLIIQPKCQYCGFLFEEMLQNKKKCPSCGKTSYIKTLPETKEKVLVTKEKADEIKAQWDFINEREKWLEHVLNVGFSERDFDNHKIEMEEKRNSNVLFKDVTWSLLNERVQPLAKELSFQELSSLYYEMALILHEGGSDPMPLLTQSRKFELLEYKKDSASIKKVEILTANSCEQCLSLKGKIFTVAGALKLMPLPCKECTTWKEEHGYGFCRCIYLPVLRG